MLLYGEFLKACFFLEYSEVKPKLFLCTLTLYKYGYNVKVTKGDQDWNVLYISNISKTTEYTKTKCYTCVSDSQYHMRASGPSSTSIICLYFLLY